MKSFFTFDLKGLAIRLDALAEHHLSAKYRTTYSEFLVLISLSYCKTLTQKEIASWTQLSEMVVSKLVRSLESQKKLIRAKDPSNKKTNLVTISQKSAEQSWIIMQELEDLFMNSLDKNLKKQVSIIHPIVAHMRDLIKATKSD